MISVFPTINRIDDVKAIRHNRHLKNLWTLKTREVSKIVVEVYISEVEVTNFHIVFGLVWGDVLQDCQCFINGLFIVFIAKVGWLPNNFYHYRRTSVKFILDP